MKVLILYSTKTGTTEKCAEMLADKLLKGSGIQCDVFPAARVPASIAEYAAVVVGGYIRFGRFGGEIAKLLKKRGGDIMRTKTAYFCCCGFSENAAQYFEDNIGHELCSKAVCTASFGGMVNADKLKGMSKVIANAVMANDTERPPLAIDENAIDEFVNKLSGELLRRS